MWIHNKKKEYKSGTFDDCEMIRSCLAWYWIIIQHWIVIWQQYIVEIIQILDTETTNAMVRPCRRVWMHLSKVAIHMPIGLSLRLFQGDGRRSRSALTKASEFKSFLRGRSCNAEALLNLHITPEQLNGNRQKREKEFETKVYRRLFLDDRWSDGRQKPSKNGLTWTNQR